VRFSPGFLSGVGFPSSRTLEELLSRAPFPRRLLQRRGEDCSGGVLSSLEKFAPQKNVVSCDEIAPQKILFCGEILLHTAGRQF
jgi:hypothetical protein